ncbi:DUF1127 domain-containing protein [Yoonia sp.]|uniref:DUF1127 domain-containing protein n=1 Tax=Yoonia sp. TaxID=2212373 RepID=UPI0023B76C07
MAFYTAAVDAPQKDSVISRMVAHMTGVFARISDAQSRTDKVNRLRDLSDEDLAKIGLRRADIVRHVYRDIYHI